jgi:hypothetical protein
MRIAVLIMMLIFLLPIIGVVLLLLKLAKKNKDSYWKGTISDKYTSEIEDDDGHESTVFILEVAIDGGGKRKVTVRKAMYDDCQVGNTLEKPKGAFNPVKV